MSDKLSNDNDKDVLEGGIISDTMPIYSPQEVSNLIGVKIPTLRKYSQMLERQGYEIARNSQNHRYYTDKDVISLRRIITASNSGITLEEAIKGVVNTGKHTPTTNDINIADMEDVREIVEIAGRQYKQMTEKLDEQAELIQEQRDLIMELAQRMNEQQTYIDKRMNERDKLLLESMNEIQESKGGLFARLFSRNK